MQPAGQLDVAIVRRALAAAVEEGRAVGGEDALGDRRGFGHAEADGRTRQHRNAAASEGHGGQQVDAREAQRVGHLVLELQGLRLEPASDDDGLDRIAGENATVAFPAQPWLETQPARKRNADAQVQRRTDAGRVAIPAAVRAGFRIGEAAAVHPVEDARADAQMQRHPRGRRRSGGAVLRMKGSGCEEEDEEQQRARAGTAGSGADV